MARDRSSAPAHGAQGLARSCAAALGASVLLVCAVWAGDPAKPPEGGPPAREAKPGDAPSKPKESQPEGADLKKTGEAFIGLLAKGEFAKAVEQFDDTMKGALPADKLRAVWEGLQAQAGRFGGIGGTDQVREQDYDVVFVKCRFEKAPLEAKLVYNDARKIAGLFFLPPRPDAASYAPPGYVRPDRFTETASTVGEGADALPGMLVIPAGAGPFPGLVLVHGSGPHDRDEAIGPNRPFRDLALGLGSRGVAVLRYDKRTLARKESLRTLGQKITLREETTLDALAAVRRLRTTARVDPRRIFVLGHSLGGIAAVRMTREDPDLSGIVLVATPGRPLEDLIADQFAYLFGLDGMLSEDELARLDEARRQAKNVKDLDGDGTKLAAEQPPDDAGLPFGLGAAYWGDLHRNPAVPMAAQARCPIFVVQGGRDYQVTESDFEVWRRGLEGRGNARLQLYPDLNHLLMEGTGKATPDEYARPGHVAQSVIEDIAAWIAAVPSAA